MKKFLQLMIASCLATGFSSAFTGHASAQARQVVAASGAQALSAPPAPLARNEHDDSSPKRDPHPMATAGIGLKVGAAGMGSGQLKLSSGGESYTGRVDARRGLHLAVPIDVGGDGFGWTFEPYISFASMSLQGSSGGVTTSANLTSYGMYTGPAVHIQVMQPLYVGIGAGLKAAYVHSDAFQYAADAYLRAPINATYYLHNQVALVAELGFGYGISAYVNKPAVTVDPVTRVVTNEKEDPQFGKAFAWDCTIGVRLP